MRASKAQWEWKGLDWEVIWLVDSFSTVLVVVVGGWRWTLGEMVVLAAKYYYHYQVDLQMLYID